MNFEHLQEIREEVAKYGEHITLIAATKTQSKEVIDEFASVAPDFVLGENRVQELIEKYDDRYVWHMIGQLQTNKVKYVIDKVALIHSLDRIELAKEIEKQAKKHSKIQPCLVEVNMGAELTKGGVAPDCVLDFIKSLACFEHIRIEGIMSVLPNLGDEDKLHEVCGALYEIYNSAKEIEQDNVEIKYLSAGMTNDYKIALAHGANMIRLGRAIFGERQYLK